MTGRDLAPISWRALASMALALAACGPTTSPQTGGSSSTRGETGPPASSTVGSMDASGTGQIGSGSSADGTTTADTTGTTADTTGGQVCVPACNFNGDCNDGIDNDGDGLADTEDPDCISPCHDCEETAYHGIPKGGGDCKQDCYWDDNTGQGDDGCVVDMRCDPLGPKAWFFGCGADPDSPACLNQEDPVQECVDVCIPMTPPGCDCFGCCTLPTPRGPEDRWLGDPMCTLTDPSSCPPCTQNDGCVNLCDDPCEWCIGQAALPPGCPVATCEHGLPCTDHCDCAEGSACLQGCCRPVVIGFD